MESPEIVIFIAVSIVVTLAGFFFKRSKTAKAVTESRVPLEPVSHQELVKTERPLPEVRSEEPTPPTLLPLSEKLGKTRSSLFGRLSRFVEGSSNLKPESKEWDAIEEILLEADVGVHTSGILLERAKEKLRVSQGMGLRTALHGVGTDIFSPLAHGARVIGAVPKPLVISIVGVNGVGKTTTIGKLAHQFIGSGKTVLLGAADTFRAGAIAQLKVWADRTGAQFVTGREGADPGAVSFDSVTAGLARGIDVVLLDTAGRLHTKVNLMEELKKIHRVIKKVIPDAPHETWLVIDGTLGQNSVAQAKEFQKTLELTGVIVTKLDGTAKGGALLSIASELKLPIRYIGIGESVEDLTPFEPEAFLQAILG